MTQNFFSFLKDLLLNPKQVFTNNLKDQSGDAPYFMVLILIYGTGKAIDRFDKQFLKYDLRGDFDKLEFFNSWIPYWIFVIIFGIVAGLISYYIGGWFFNLRLKWSKGDSNLSLSRDIFLYSRTVFSIAIIFTTIIQTFIADKPYISNGDVTSWDIASIVIIITFMYHSTYIGYTGVRTLTNANKTRSLIWFVILPMLLFLSAFATLVVLLSKMNY